jgi:tetratricopeptide (TPR) repeat protein
MSILAQWLSLLARPFGLAGAARIALGAIIAAVGLAGLMIVALRRHRRRAANRAIQAAAASSGARAGVAVAADATPAPSAALEPREMLVPTRPLPGVLAEVIARPVRVSGPTQPLRFNRVEAVGGQGAPPTTPGVPGSVAVADRPTASPPRDPLRDPVGTRDAMPVEIALQGLDLLVPPPPERADTLEPTPPGAPPDQAAADAAADAEAQAHHQRGLALLAGGVGEHAENTEAPREAIACFRRAQQVWTRAAAPERWATAENDIAHAYQEMLDGDRVAHLQAAIEHHTAALEVFDPVHHALSWAWTQSALGAAYQNLPVGSPLVNARTAVAFHQRALDVFTQEQTPLAWAWNQNNLGAALELMRGGADGEWVKRLHEAEECYEAALEVYTSDAYPMPYQVVTRNLARVRAELRALD